MIKVATTDEEILKCHEVIFALRPKLKDDIYLNEMKKTLADNRMLIFVEEKGKALSCSVFEWGYNLYRGKYIYIDDLSTMPEARGKGYASQLLNWIINYANENKFDQVHLDSGVRDERFDAHRLYLNKRFNITSLHFALEFKN
ncbi:MAG: GNAT family N-acetyltransferase [Chitinophagales bacterium]|nr:GNAT family N-acetyltransferase [Chitinophagales bacterium]